MFGIHNKLNKKQKATQGIATTSFPQSAGGIGLVQPTTALVAGDRGCFPTYAADGDAATQAAATQLALAQGVVATPAGTSTDYIQAYVLLCLTSGTCCTTDLCNTMSRIEMSFVPMLMSIVLALIGVFKGF